MRNGIIGFLVKSNKMIDLKITNSFPLLTIGKNTSLIFKNSPEICYEDYQHFSIPSDLNIHLTANKKDHIFFVHEQIQSELEKNKAIHLFTYVSKKYENCEPLGKHKWNGAAIISPFTDEYFSIKTSRLWIDFIIHEKNAKIETNNTEFFLSNMRLACDREGYMVGPFSFESIQRKSKGQIDDLAFSIRMGFCENESDIDNFIYVPFDIKRNNGT
jgi:hypothetical protein